MARVRASFRLHRAAPWRAGCGQRRRTAAAPCARAADVSPARVLLPSKDGTDRAGPGCSPAPATACDRRRGMPTVIGTTIERLTGATWRALTLLRTGHAGPPRDDTGGYTLPTAGSRWASPDRTFAPVRHVRLAGSTRSDPIKIDGARRTRCARRTPVVAWHHRHGRRPVLRRPTRAAGGEYPASIHVHYDHAPPLLSERPGSSRWVGIRRSSLRQRWWSCRWCRYKPPRQPLARPGPGRRCVRTRKRKRCPRRPRNSPIPNVEPHLQRRSALSFTGPPAYSRDPEPGVHRSPSPRAAVPPLRLPAPRWPSATSLWPGVATGGGEPGVEPAHLGVAWCVVPHRHPTQFR